MKKTYTEKEEAQYCSPKILRINRLFILLLFALFASKAAHATFTKPNPQITQWDGAGNTWTCGNCGASNYCWQMSCTNCGGL